MFTPDLHVGFERKNDKLEPLHDAGAIQGMLAFAKDYKPDVFILGGDQLDCGPVSHWLKNKKASMQELDLHRDAKLLQTMVIDKVNALKPKRKIFMLGNHEAWLNQAVEESPGLKNILRVEQLLDLKGWEIVKQGGSVKLGHLYFIHGDSIGNVKSLADQALVRNRRPVRFGHFHTYQATTGYSALDVDETHTAIAVPGLCNKNPNYAEGRPNQWLKGFNFGVIKKDGTFHDHVPIICNGSFYAEGKLYSVK